MNRLDTETVTSIETKDCGCRMALFCYACQSYPCKTLRNGIVQEAGHGYPLITTLAQRRRFGSTEKTLRRHAPLWRRHYSKEGRRLDRVAIQESQEE